MDLRIEKKELIIARYKEYLKQQGKSEQTIQTYKIYVNKFIQWLKKDRVSDIKEIQRDTIDRYREGLFSQTNPVLSLKTQSLYLVALRSFYQYLIRHGHVIYNPTSHIELPKVPKTLPRMILNEKQIKRLLGVPEIDTALGLRDRAILEVLYSTGMRNTELRNLKLYDIDFEKQTIRIEKGKGGKCRIVPLGEVAHIYVREYLRSARLRLLTKGRKKISRGNTDILFLSIFGKKLDISALPYIIQKYLSKAGIKEQITAHTIRHTTATHLLKHHAPLRCIQELLGHSSLDTTQKYLRVEITDLKKVHKKSHPREKE